MLTVDQVVNHQVQIERYKAGLAKRIKKASAKLSKEILPVLNNMENLSKGSINLAISNINRLIDKNYTSLEEELMEEFLELLEQQLVWVADREDVVLEKENQDIVVSTLGMLVMGHTFNKLLAQSKGSLKNQIISNMRIAATDNFSITEMKRLIRGTQGTNFKDGVFSRNAKNITTIVNTTIQSMVNNIKKKVWELQSVKKYIWLSVLDSRTTPICRSRSSVIYELGSGPFPPAHYNCRSTVAPYVDGQSIPQNYGDWLKTQPRGVVQDILGKKKADLFLSGKVSLQKFVAPSGRELTLKELQKRLDRI